jgi:hypothetical protein
VITAEPCSIVQVRRAGDYCKPKNHGALIRVEVDDKIFGKSAGVILGEMFRSLTLSLFLENDFYYKSNFVKNIFRLHFP